MDSKEEKQWREANWRNYKRRWGNYQSDKHKSKSIVRSEITTILHLGTFTKKDLVKIKDYVKALGFAEFG